MAYILDTNVFVRLSQQSDPHARLVASMNVYGVQQILTFNTQDFKRFPAVMAIHPKDVS